MNTGKYKAINQWANELSLQIHEAESAFIRLEEDGYVDKYKLGERPRLGSARQDVYGFKISNKGEEYLSKGGYLKKENWLIKNDFTNLKWIISTLLAIFAIILNFLKKPH
ncbi:MAG: hypothetical protein IPM51_13285 [Sphingobacteriaceae bacterium]|nr:hypothetical protein [Sphingobacteriaceae bacterium]